jgi:hypothetical protein
MSIFVPIAISYGLGGFVAYLFVLLVTSTEHTELLYFGTEGSGPLCKLSRNKRCDARFTRTANLSQRTRIPYKAINDVKDIQSHLS